ncbi:MAG: hypothetical protein IJO14_02270 [Clostridia bacterium]|nr:hypothetical protein [Clostridia bacterium]
MASRIMHFAIANELQKQVNIKDPQRFCLGILLPDAYVHSIQAATDSHLKYTVADGQKKTYRLQWFRETYAQQLQNDDLYLGYYLHLIQDMVFRRFVYDMHNWDPYPQGNIERLHNDYKLLNDYLVKQYTLCNTLRVPDDVHKEALFSIYPFDLPQLQTDFAADFEPYCEGEIFFFTHKMADEYIAMATQHCIAEMQALQAGGFTFDEEQWAWDKNPPKKLLKDLLRKGR